MTILRLAVFLVLIVLCPILTLAQQNPGPSRLVLEVTYFPGRKPAYQPVPAAEARPNGSWYGMFGRVAFEQTRAGAASVEAVRILSRVEGDAVRVIVSTLSGKKALENEQPVGSYLLRETEKMSVEDLRAFGIEPFGIKLIRVTPNLAPVPPVVFKGVQSLTLVTAVSNDTTLPSYTVTLLNQSSHNVLGLGVDLFADDKIAISSRPQGKEGQFLIAVGKQHELIVRAPVRAQESAGGFTPGAPSQQRIVIKAAVFDDGSYEGDIRVAGSIRGSRAGEKMEITRALAVFANALATLEKNSAEKNVTGAYEDLLAQISSLSSDADPELVRDLAAELTRNRPSQNKANTGEALLIQGIKAAVEFSAETIKSNLLKEIKKLQPENATGPDVNAFRVWLVSTSDRYDKWLARL